MNLLFFLLDVGLLDQDIFHNKKFKQIKDKYFEYINEMSIHKKEKVLAYFTCFKSLDFGTTQLANFIRSNRIFLDIFNKHDGAKVKLRNLKNMFSDEFYYETLRKILQDQNLNIESIEEAYLTMLEEMNNLDKIYDLITDLNHFILKSFNSGKFSANYKSQLSKT